MQNGKLRLEDVNIADPATVRRAVGAAAVGNITEWYDFGVYGYLATTITKVFFSGLPPAMGTIATFGLFAVSFLIRPFGSLFFGPLGDRIGRKRVLSITVILMAAGTFVIGVVPSYAQIGIAAPLLVLLARLIQGVSTGGEYGNAMTFIAEYAPDRRRGFFGSWLEFGTLTGYAFGATIATVLSGVLSTDQLLSWGWRIPFLIALPLGVVGLYLRLKLEETPAFAELMKKAGDANKPKKSEYRTVFVDYWRVMLLCGGLVLAWNVTNYMLTSYFPTYLTDTLPSHGHTGTGETAAEVLQIVMLVVLMVVITFLGRLSDKVGRRKVVLAGCVGLVVLSLPAVLLLQAGGDVRTLAGLLITGLILICFSAVLPSTLPAMFPTHIRAGGLSISFNIAVSLFGGTTSAVMSALVAGTGDLNWPAYYLMAAGVVGAICILLTRETARRPLDGSAPIVESRQEARDVVSAQR
ncbi:MFS transporter [Amycolatopsis acidiphila]|uniref:MFS transporter n=1 Tax=Amycolatopsis acidiphila TaxID=715473 RepID=UPI0019A9BFAC|nr:MFS transporter [Amycolatopsis acidiphila]UIJ61235.1 MFS transporter [Amycolatopsis acidiphila]GHG78655.1 MFS transporter [Amycolatopsis acidiphila]